MVVWPTIWNMQLYHFTPKVNAEMPANLSKQDSNPLMRQRNMLSMLSLTFIKIYYNSSFFNHPTFEFLGFSFVLVEGKTKAYATLILEDLLLFPGLVYWSLKKGLEYLKTNWILIPILLFRVQVTTQLWLLEQFPMEPIIPNVEPKDSLHFSLGWHFTLIGSKLTWSKQ